MSKTPHQSLPDLLVTLYSNIVQQASEDKLPTAEKAFYLIRDYSLGDTISCSAEAALQNCEQIQSCFPRDAPEGIFLNLDKVRRAIKRHDRNSNPNILNRLFFPILFVAAIVIIYWIISRDYY